MTNVLIIGAGGGGMAAAIEAHDAGAEVQIVEAAEKPGGSTAMSAGVIYAAGTHVQREAGVEGDKCRGADRALHGDHPTPTRAPSRPSSSATTSPTPYRRSRLLARSAESVIELQGGRQSAG
jgi:phytoene dehydrogenase-like protein